MKILDSDQLIVNLSFLLPEPTGLSVYANNLMPYLRSLDPTPIAAQDISNYNSYLIDLNSTPTRGTNRHLDRLLWTQFQLPKIYDRLGASLLFSPIPEAPIFAGCRYIITVHDLIPLRFPRLSSPLHHYFRWHLPQVLSQSTHIICNSTATATELIDRFHIPTTKITPIPLACDTNNFHVNDEDRADIPYFLYVGRHDPHKNVARIITAFSQLSNRECYQLWLVGSGDTRYTPLLRTQVAELGLTEQVRFKEYIPYQSLSKIIRQANALVFPSLWEGFGLPVLEAMACGTPVITSNLSALIELARDAAILVDPYDINQIADAMRMVAEDSQLRSQLRQAGLARAKLFSWEKTGKETAAVLKRYL